MKLRNESTNKEESSEDDFRLKNNKKMADSSIKKGPSKGLNVLLDKEDDDRSNSKVKK